MLTDAIASPLHSGRTLFDHCGVVDAAPTSNPATLCIGEQTAIAVAVSPLGLVWAVFSQQSNYNLIGNERTVISRLVSAL